MPPLAGVKGVSRGWQRVHWGLAGSVFPQRPTGVLAASGDIEGLLGVGGVRMCKDSSGSVGVSGVHWGLAGSVGALGPAGVSVASGGIGRLLEGVGDIRGCQGYIGGWQGV